MQQRKKITRIIGVSILLAAIIGVSGVRLTSRARASIRPEPAVSEKTVAAVKVGRADLARTISLAAEMRPWQEIDVHAKVSGYLKEIVVDIGDQVKAGQTIATLDVPEEDQDQAKAEADYKVAKLDYDRIETVIKKQPGLLAQEEVDKAKAAYEETKATYERMKILASYAVISAPFDGVITKRSVDPGALVQTGTSSAQAPALVHLAEIDKLRLDFPVPESIVPLVRAGMSVDVMIQATGETLHSTIARMSDKIDPATRTMDVEVDLDNMDLRLKPGLYATAILTLDASRNALAVPVQAVSTDGAPNVWVINASHVVEARPVVLGIQMPDNVEIKSGISEGDTLVYGNRSDISPGMKAVPKLVTAGKG